MKMEINITREDGFVSSNSAKAPRAVFFLLVCLINGEGSALGGKLGRAAASGSSRTVQRDRLLL